MYDRSQGESKRELGFITNKCPNKKISKAFKKKLEDLLPKVEIRIILKNKFQHRIDRTLIKRLARRRGFGGSRNPSIIDQTTQYDCITDDKRPWQHKFKRTMVAKD